MVSRDIWVELISICHDNKFSDLFLTSSWNDIINILCTICKSLIPLHSDPLDYNLGVLIKRAAHILYILSEVPPMSIGLRRHHIAVYSTCWLLIGQSYQATLTAELIAQSHRWTSLQAPPYRLVQKQPNPLDLVTPTIICPEKWSKGDTKNARGVALYTPKRKYYK